MFLGTGQGNEPPRLTWVVMMVVVTMVYQGKPEFDEDPDGRNAGSQGQRKLYHQVTRRVEQFRQKETGLRIDSKGPSLHPNL